LHITNLELFGCCKLTDIALACIVDGCPKLINPCVRFFV